MHVWVARAATAPPQVLVTRYDPGKVAPNTSESPLVLSFSVVDEQSTLTLLETSDLAWGSLRRLSLASMPLVGLLGLLRVGTNVFLVAVSASERVGELHGNTVHRVRNVSFFCLNRRLSNDVALAQGTLDLDDSSRLPFSTSTGSEDPLAAIRKYLSGGSFYFTASPYGLTQRLQSTNKTDHLFQQQFIWNTHMLEPLEVFCRHLDSAQLRRFDEEDLCLSVIQGYVGIRRIPGPVPSQLAVVSRLSSERAGTRYNMRGIDDDGHTANFVETETMLMVDKLTFSYVQLRGSVPIFWEQQGLQALSAKIQVTRTGAASLPAFQQHMDDLLTEYQSVCVLDLLGTREAERALSDAYKTHLSELDVRVPYVHCDFHAVTRSFDHLEDVAQELARRRDVQAQRESQHYALYRGSAEMQRQSGIFRVNCFDCLDRTNLVQSLLSHATMRDWLAMLRAQSSGEPSVAAWAGDAATAASLRFAHREVWVENGDALSVISTGTGSLSARFARSGAKKAWTGLLSDAAKSASRLYVNHFQDSGKQEAIDLLLGQRSGQRRIELYDPLYAGIGAELEQCWADYASVHHERLFVGTFNVCAIAPRQIQLGDWLCPDTTDDVLPGIVAVCLQEMVPLTAQQMLLTSSDELAAWEAALLQTLSAYGTKYVPLRHALLFGTGLLTFAQASLLPHIRCVEGATKKTGFRGMSGNKGGVSVRLDLFDTSICIVGAHLAAGTNNTDERNNDYASLVRGLTFARGRMVEEHDVIVWAGDLNYRLRHPSNEEVRELCAAHKYTELAEEDQLTWERRAGAGFRGYDEAPLAFPPTYKYDIGTDLYDTSEKMRPPAWTDRVLFRSTNAHLGIRAQAYSSVQSIRISDHRPVYALLDLDIGSIDAAAKATVHKKLLQARQQQVAKGPWWLQGPEPLDPHMGEAIVGNPWSEKTPAETVACPAPTSRPPLPPRPGNVPGAPPLPPRPASPA